MDYRKEAEKLVDEIARLEKEYVRNFQALLANKDRGKDISEELKNCEMIARRLEKLDPDFRLQTDATLPKPLKGIVDQNSDTYKDGATRRERFVRTAMNLLKIRKYKPLK